MVPIKLLESHPIEKIMGINYYCTQTEGIGGKLRTLPEDFVVEEILPDGRIIKISDQKFILGENKAGLFTEFILIKRNIESHRALLEIAKALKKQIQDIKIAGTKDKSAITAQKATIWKVKPKDLMKLQIDGLEIRSPKTTIYQTFLGNLSGNHFTITIRDINLEKTMIKERIDAIVEEITQFGGIGNFFGHQRFGSRRPISHEVGKEIIRGNIDEAIWIYLTKIYDDEHELTKKARKTLLETDDFSDALDLFSREMIFEKNIIRHLIKHPKDYYGAFKQLPINLQRMFIHAYQSYIWNVVLSNRIERYGNLLPQKEDCYEGGEAIIPILGSKTELQDSIFSEDFERLLEKDDIRKEDFELPKINWLKFTGSNRPMILQPENLTVNEIKTETQEDAVKLEFSLKSGSYATVILREFMKSAPISY